MKVSNKLNLPEAFVKAVSVYPHNKKGFYSATTLNKGTKEIVLSKRHFDEIEVDAADSLWAVWGTAVHTLMENQPDNNFHEERFRVSVSNSFVTGQIDSYDMENEVIYDWKTASVWKIKMNDFSDWKKQGLTYAWLLAQSGLNVRKCRFVALIKDHSKTQAMRESGYPQSPVYVYEFDVTPEDLKAHGEWILSKVQEVEKAETLQDDEIEPCTADERWADGEKFAVMKKGRKSAIRLFDTMEDANNYPDSTKPGYYIEHRPAINRKCEGYCSCSQFCSFYKNIGGK